MKFGIIFLLSAQAVLAQSPVLFEQLDVVYRLSSGPRLVETRSGRIRWTASPALDQLKQVVLASLNAAGEANAREWILTRADGSSRPISPGRPSRSGDLLYWQVSDVQAGDSLQFTTEQPVDISVRQAGAWWFSDRTTIPLPVQHGSLRLILPADFSGSQDLRGASQTSWVLDNPTSVRFSNHFTLSSFSSWSDFAQWVSRTCQIPGAPGELPSAAEARGLVESISRGFHRHIASEIGYECRPREQARTSGAANQIEVVRAFADAKLAHEVFLAGRDLTATSAVNPSLVSQVLVRVDTRERPLWFNASHLAGADGVLPPESLAEAFLSLRTHHWTSPPVQTADITAKYDAAILSKGSLQAELVIESRSLSMREAFQAGLNNGRSLSDYLSPSMQKHHIRGSVMFGNAYDSGNTLVVRLLVFEEQLVPAIDRVANLPMSALRLAPDPVKLPDGKLLLGATGVLREEISVTAPSSFKFVGTDVQIDEDLPFASYWSKAGVVDGALHIARELRIKQSILDTASTQAQVALWKMITTDQEHSFVLRRLRAVDTTTWVNSIPPYQAHEMGLKAYDQREYEAARALFEKATKNNPKDLNAWNNLGRALAALHRDSEAIRAYETQIGVNSNDHYAYNNMGLVYSRQEQWNKAVASYRKQLEVHPGDEYSIRNLPRALMQSHQWAEAIDASLAATKSQPTNTTYPVYAAVARVCLGQASDPKAELEKVTRSAASANNAAFHLTECGKELELAETLAKRALNRQGQQVAAVSGRSIGSELSAQTSWGTHLDTYGWLLFKAGRTGEALAPLQAAAAFSGSSETCLHLALALEKAGQHADALRWARDATDSAPGLLPLLPPALGQDLSKAQPITVDGTWQLLNSVGGSLDAPVYFFVSTSAQGNVETARLLGSDNSESQPAAAAVRTLHLPVVQPDGSPSPGVYLIKVAPSGGTLNVFWSVRAEAVRIASELVPDEFPAPAIAAQ